jgi:hypothetical protein
MTRYAIEANQRSLIHRMIRARRRIVALFLVAMVIMSGGYLYAQFGQEILDGFGSLRGEQGDLAERPPEQWPDRNVAGCHLSALK